MSEGVFGRCIFNRIACSHKVSQTIQAEVERLVAAEAEVQCEIGDKMHDFMFQLRSIISSTTKLIKTSITQILNDSITNYI